jgi:hypothetical protein
MQRDAYRQYLYETVLVKRMRLNVRNQQTRMWGLHAKRDLKAGEFIGIYTGSYASLTCPLRTRYAVDIGPSQPCIVPFPDEDQITPNERETHPLACMNEPSEGEFANTHMVIQDFTHAEVEGVQSIPYHEQARFFRCMACFACEGIRRGDALTWNYGNSYEPIRTQLGYVAGQPSQRVLTGEEFIAPNSEGVLDALQRVPHYAVFPVFQSQTLKSSRFKKHRRHSVDSEGEESESFSSGSEHAAETYQPRPTARMRGEAAGPS